MAGQGSVQIPSSRSGGALAWTFLQSSSIPELLLECASLIWLPHKFFAQTLYNKLSGNPQRNFLWHLGESPRESLLSDSKATYKLFFITYLLLGHLHLVLECHNYDSVLLGSHLHLPSYPLAGLVNSREIYMTIFIHFLSFFL